MSWNVHLNLENQNNNAPTVQIPEVSIRYAITKNRLSTPELNAQATELIYSAIPLPEDGTVFHDGGFFWFVAQQELTIYNGDEELDVARSIHNGFHLHGTSIESSAANIMFYSNGIFIRSTYCVLRKWFKSVEQMVSTSTALPNEPRLRYIRVKDVGTRISSEDQRNKKIVDIAGPLPEGNVLNARAVYWFVANEPVDVIFEDKKLFILKESQTVESKHLYQIDFRLNRQGELWFRFSDGHEEHVICSSKAYSLPRANKRVQGEGDKMKLDNDSESAHYENIQNNNTNVLPQEHEPIPHHLQNYIQTPIIEPLIVNILLLVPYNIDVIQRVQKALLKLKYKKEARSDKLHLFSHQQFVNKTRHVLIFPYKEIDAAGLQDMLPAASDVVVLLESDHKEGQKHITTVTHVNSIMRFIDGELVSTTWKLVTKAANFGALKLEYDQIDQTAQTLFSIEELESLLSGVSCQQGLSSQDFETHFVKYLNEWSLKPPVKELQQIIYLCFKYERDSIRSFTDYAETTLNALDLGNRRAEYDSEPVVVNGSILVYIRCPLYIIWYIKLRSDDLFTMLAEERLDEIYECYQSDIEASLQRPDNQQYRSELQHVREQMICDGIAEHPLVNRFKVSTARPNFASMTVALNAISHVATAVIDTVMEAPIIWTDINTMENNQTIEAHLNFMAETFTKSEFHTDLSSNAKLLWKKRKNAFWPYFLSQEASERNRAKKLQTLAQKSEVKDGKRMKMETERDILNECEKLFPKLAMELEHYSDPQAIVHKFFGSFQFISTRLRYRLLKEGKSEEEVACILHDHEEAYNAIAEDGRRKNTLPVRLLIIPSHKTSPFRAKFGRALSFIPTVNLQYGAKHLALQIGYLLLSWFDNSFVHIDLLSSKSVMAMIYPRYPYTNVRHTDINQIAKVIVKYNTTITHDKFNFNSQRFTNDVLKSISISPTWWKNGPISKYVEAVATERIDPQVLFHFWTANGAALDEHKFYDEQQFIQWCKENGIKEMKICYGRIENENYEICKALWRASQLKTGQYITNDANLFEVEGINALTLDGVTVGYSFKQANNKYLL